MQLEKAMAPHSSTLAWKIPWTEEPGRLQSLGSLRVGHDWVTSLSPFTFMHWRRKWQPTPVFLPGESQGWRAAVCGVAQSRTQLKQLSSSSSSILCNEAWRAAIHGVAKSRTRLSDWTELNWYYAITNLHLLKVWEYIRITLLVRNLEVYSCCWL